MNGEQVGVLKSALIKCAIVAFVVILAVIAINIIAYNVGAKTDTIVSDVATQQLVDGGQAYQQMKTASQNFFELNSIFSWIRLFTIIGGIAYIIYQAFSAYKHIAELGSKKE